MPEIAVRSLLCVALALASIAGCESAAAQDISSSVLSRAIKGARVEALQDRQAINFCDVDIFWSADGTLFDDGMPRPESAPRNRSQCSGRPDSAYYARVFEVHAFADSILVRVASRFGEVGRWETLVFRRSGQSLGFLEARVTRIFWYH